MPIPEKCSNALVVRLKTMYSGARWNMGKERKRMSKALSVSTRTLGEISPLGLSKLSSILGSFLRVFGLSIAIG